MPGASSLRNMPQSVCSTGERFVHYWALSLPLPTANNGLGSTGLPCIARPPRKFTGAHCRPTFVFTVSTPVTPLFEAHEPMPLALGLGREPLVSMRNNDNGDETHGDHKKREAEKPDQQELRFFLKVALHRSLFRASRMVLMFHGSSASIASSVVAPGSCSNSSLRYSKGSTPLARAVITRENRFALA